MSKDLKWHMWRMTSTVTHIPSIPGLYAIGHNETIEGLEKERIYVYVGLSNNLNRRFIEHSLANEPKAIIRKYLRENRSKVKFWYTTDVDIKSLRRYEKKLIQKLKPKYNSTQ